jgi:phenylpropionate dioxygenase-like ring-hydroxylating dioxygenase large terminal subunit
MNASDTLAQLKANVAVPFNQARAMPKAVYTSEDFAAQEVKQIFSKEWFCVGRATALANPGDYVTLELAGQPIMVIRDREGTLRAQSNVCLHRMSILLKGTGNVKGIVCPYHGWSYNTDGSLRTAPAMKHNDAFRKEDYRLPQIRCEEWLGWVMITLNPEAVSPGEKFANVEGLISDYRMETYIENFNEQFIWNTNWKVLAENFMESYHLPVCHAKTIGGLSKLDEMICPPGLPTFNYPTILKDDTLKIALAHPSNTRMEGDRRRTTYLLAIYPSLLITLTPGYFWYLSLHPHGAGQVRVIFGGGLSPEFATDPDAIGHFRQLKALLDEVNVEDKGCTERVYRGLCSDLAKPGHLSHLERPNFDFATYITSMLK